MARARLAWSSDPAWPVADTLQEASRKVAEESVKQAANEEKEASGSDRVHLDAALFHEDLLECAGSQTRQSATIFKKEKSIP